MNDIIYYIYKITNTINDKIYIGQAVNPNKRWHNHIYSANHPKSSNMVIHSAMRKYKIENFTFEVIASCLGRDAANETEHFVINQYGCRNNKIGYNIAPGGNVRGECHQQTRDKIAKSKLGKPSKLRTQLTDEQLKIIINDDRCDAKIAKELGLCSSIIKRTRKENNAIKDRGSTKTQFSEEQIKTICSDPRQSRDICKDFGVSKTVILEIRKKNNVNMENILLKTYGKRSYPRTEAQNTYHPMTESGLESLSKKMKGKAPSTKAILTEEQIAMILDNEKSTRQLSKDSGIGSAIILRIRTENDFINKRPVAHNKKIFSADELEIILSGTKSMAKLAKEFDVSKKTIKLVIDEHGGKFSRKIPKRGKSTLKINFKPEEVARIIAGKEPAIRLAKELSVNVKTIERVIRENNGKTFALENFLTEQQIDLIKSDTIPTTRLARQFNISPTVIKRVRKQYGLSTISK